MAKEKVIIFEDEDKFVLPRTHTFDTAKGESTFVPANGEAAKTEDVYVATVMPVLGESDYCNRLQAYINTRGENTATPEQVMIAYQNFQTNCLSTSTTSSTTTLLSTQSTTTTTTAAPQLESIAQISIPSGMGKPIARGGSAESKAPAETPKKTYWWLLLVAAGAYLVFRKKK